MIFKRGQRAKSVSPEIIEYMKAINIGLKKETHKATKRMNRAQLTALYDYGL